jgi:hypothetical protein
MKRNVLFILSFLAGLAVAAFLIGLPGNNQPASQAIQAQDVRALEEQTKSAGEVSVAVTPSFAGAWRFAITLETHSVELSQALEQVSVLTDNQGREYAPVSWEGDPPGGHHRSGTLLFGDVDTSARTLALNIRTIGGIPDRLFTWEVR